MQEWYPISTAPEHVFVRTRVTGARGSRLEARLMRRGELWFTGGRRPTFVHHTPTEWKPD